MPTRPLRSLSYLFWNSRGFCATNDKLFRRKRKLLAKYAPQADIIGIQEGHVRLSDLPALRRYALRHDRVLYYMEGRKIGDGPNSRISLGGFFW
jgi:hypothetical protein